MATDREKEREAELESAMYTNCRLLGLDPSIIGGGVGGVGGTPRVGLFRHSNPRLGEQLLYFLLSALRGPVQSAKDFDKVWPIFDSAQSRDFRKIVQGIISELESQGALPRSNARVSSLATCCGPRFVELLWQLSVHALREVHRRTFAADVASNPLPASLTDASYLHAAALLPVTKARIALERRKFLKNANIAVHSQATWSNLANEMTAEFRALCAEEAYLQQELEKLQDLRNKAKLDGELWDDSVSTSSQNSHLVSKATRLWESLLSRKSQHEALASGPIEDLIANREHRYRISGSSLLAAMDMGSHVSYSALLSARASETSSTDNCENVDSPQIQRKADVLSRIDDKSGRGHPTVDVAEVIRRWTHALQRIHKQSLHLAKAKDGEGPELLRCASENGNGSHAESLAATLAEHRQHLVSIQGLINKLKEAVPAMQNSIAELTEEVNSISPLAPDEYNERTPPIQAQNSGRNLENTSDELVEMTSNLYLHPDKVSSSPAFKLPQLFSLTPNSSRKGMHAGKRHSPSAPLNRLGILMTDKPSAPAPSFVNDLEDVEAEDVGIYAQNLRRAVREAALSGPSSNSEISDDKSSEDGSEHFFIPLSSGAPQKAPDAAVSRRKQPPFSSLDIEDSLEQVFSPPFLMDSSFFSDTYEDLLAPLSDTDAALMESSGWLQHNLPTTSDS